MRARCLFERRSVDDVVICHQSVAEEAIGAEPKILFGRVARSLCFRIEMSLFPHF